LSQDELLFNCEEGGKDGEDGEDGEHGEDEEDKVILECSVVIYLGCNKI
jgi:hypothetical protein